MPADAIPDLPVPITRAKLHPPPMAADAITRERLLPLAENVAGVPLTLVSAPAGYGKSTLISQWLQTLEQESAWVSLDVEDSDIRRFLSYVVAALRGPYPGCCTGIVELLRSQVMPDVKDLASGFCNEVETLEGPVILVLDDFHEISPSDTDEFLDIVLKHPPRNLHLVIATRRNPSLSLNAMRARGVIVEVRMQRLAFQEDETRAFMRAALGASVSDDDIVVLQERTEGWPAALRLTVLALAESVSPAHIVSQLPTGTRAIPRYLLREVLTKQPASVRERLLRVAFLDRFCPELCDAVMPGSGAEVSAESFLNHVRQTNLFSIALDESGNWYRFHHLFQSMLQERSLTDLGKEAVGAIHLRASMWFEEHEFLSDAIQHALSANRPDVAADVIGRHRNTIMNHEWWHQLGLWLRGLPPEIVTARPELLLLKARLFRTTGQNAEFAETLETAESLLESSDIEEGQKNELRASVESMRCFQWYVASDGVRAARAARRALELLSSSSQYERSFAVVLLSAALQMTGDSEGAKRAVYSAIADVSAREESSAGTLPELLVSLCFVHWMDADLHELKLAAERTAELCSSEHNFEVLTDALHFKAAVHFHVNDLAAIDADLQPVVRKRAIANAEFHAHSLIIAGLANEALGRPAEAQEAFEVLHGLAFRTQNTHLIQLCDAFGAELSLRQGRMAEALKWTQQYDPEPLSPMYAFFSPPMCLAKILVLDDSPASQERALRLLPRLEEYLAGIHNKRFLIEALALRAILSDKTGEAGLAVEQLEKAVSLAQTGGFIRLFVDLGPQLAPMLNRLELKGEKLDYVGRILAAFRAEGSRIYRAHADIAVGVPVEGIAGLPEPLSRRENEVLQMLAGHLTNKEIGERLYISPNTVKRHAHSIYEKLNVTGRREAITKAVGLGLIAD